MESSLSVRKRWKYIITVSFLFLLVEIIYTTTIGPASISFREAVGIILSRFSLLESLFGNQEYAQVHETIIWTIRMPRVVLAVLVGGALAVVGVTFQGFFRNSMADPYVIGISSGAALGATIGILTGVGNFLGMFRVPLFAFGSALVTTWVVYNLSKVGTKVLTHTLLLAGIALSAFMSAVMSFMMVLNAEEMHKVFYWLMGSFANRDWEHVIMVSPLILIGTTLLMFYAKELNAMLFGDSTAQHLGVNTDRLKIILLVLGSLTAAGAVAVCGTIGFVGLIIPHMVRILVGPDHRILLPMSFLVGAMFMVATDTFARTFFAPIEIPIGIITSLFGGPFFIYLLRKKKVV